MCVRIPVFENIPSLYKRSREWCYRGSVPPNVDDRTSVTRNVPGRSSELPREYNRVSFCSLIGHFSILLNPCWNDIMLPAEWLNWTEREIIAVAKLAREIWCRVNGKCASEAFHWQWCSKSREDTDVKLSRTNEAASLNDFGIEIKNFDLCRNEKVSKK